MKDYKLELKIKNNYLIEKMAEVGISSAAELSRQSGVNVTAINNIMRLKLCAYTPQGDIRKPVKALCDFLCCAHDEIFPPQHIAAPLGESAFSGFLDMYELQQLSQSPEQIAQNDEAAESVHNVLEQIKPRQAKVLKMIYGIGGADEQHLRQVGAVFDVTPERIKQIRDKAITTLQHSRYSHQIKDAL